MKCLSCRTRSALVVGCAALVVWGCGGSSGSTASSPLPSSNGPVAEDQSQKVSEGEQQAEAACTAALARSTTKSSARPGRRALPLPRRPDDPTWRPARRHRRPYATGAYPDEPAIRSTLHLTNKSKAGFSTSAVEVQAAYDEKSLGQAGVSEVAEVTVGSAALEFLVP